MATSNTQAAIYRQEWVRNLKRIIGEHPAHNLIAGLTRAVKGGGESTWIAGIDAAASTDADTATATSRDSVKKYHEEASESIANWMLTRTPYMGTYKLTSLSTPKLIDWGNTWNVTEDDEWLTVVNPKSADMSVCAQKIHKRLDLNMGLAVTASTVQRKLQDASVAAVSLPSAQTMDDLTYATATVDTLPAQIRETLGNAYLSAGMPVYCAVSTTLARHLKANSSNLLRSRDFIASYAEYRAGTLPTVEGVTFIELPKTFMESVKAKVDDQIDHYFAWTPEAIASVSYKPLSAQIAQDPGGRFDEIGYVSQIQDYVRTDDKGVVVGDIIT